MSKKKYWQSFGELNHTESFQESTKNEFKEELLPLADLDDKGILDAKTPRRDFLKYLGFSTAAAAIAASCEVPVRKVVPYLNRPDNVIPGVANYYASTYVNGGDVISVVVKQRDGRPIKIEGNELSTITNGGTSAQAQASVLDLYDNTRLRYPMEKTGQGFKEVPGFDAFDKMVGTAMAGLAGKPVVLLTSTINSPTTLEIIKEFIAKYPGSRHVQYDAVSYSGMLQANEACYGKRAIPSYHFDNAKVIVSLGADFLGTWLSPVEFSNQYSKGRKVTGEKPELSKHFQFESMMSMTGSNADDRYTHKPSDTGAVALSLLAELGLGLAVPKITDAKLAAGIKKAAAALQASNGQGLVVCGSNDVNVQLIVNAINEQIGANGKTINWGVTSNYRSGIDSDMVTLVNEMNSGTVGAVLIYGANPAYSYFESDKFISGLNKTVSVSFNGTMDETTEQCKYILPSHHWLESWGDAEPKTGYISLLQPTINPLFKTRAFQTSLLKWSRAGAQPVATKPVATKPVATQQGATQPGSTQPGAAANSMDNDYESYFKTYWMAKLGSAELYDKALQDGVIEQAVVPVSTAAYNAGRLSIAAQQIAVTKEGKAEIVLYQKVSVGNGSQANNPWLQELPDPVSKVTWDNYAMMSPAMALKLLGLDVMNQEGGKQSDYEVHPEKPVVKITAANGKTVELPVIVIPGMHEFTVALAVGYGRGTKGATLEKISENIGRSAAGAGKNVYHLVSFKETNLYSSMASIEKTGKNYPLAQTQVHGFTESRPVIYETNLTSYAANPEALLEEVTKEREAITIEGSKDFRKDATIYPDLMEEKPGIKWGMSIDLNTCTGCSACVVACTAENNVSVVGKMQVQKAHEMHWLRIDRYFTGDLENPDVVFQPMLCQHCDNAPCENVCPVSATNHSNEGLNQMAYNRCIGTRYCANNCPYKVRRFNWLDYTGADSFPDNQNPLIGSYMDNSVLQMNDDLTRMVLNPDVTVRSRGVMEKCSFCVQRLQDSKLEAKKQQDTSLIRNVKTACMQACPTHAISFGNVNDKESDIYKIRHVEQKHRAFYVLEQLHVLPNVNYLAKVRNTDRHIGVEHHEEKKEVKAHV